MNGENKAPRREAALECLQELLEILFPDPSPDVFTLESFNYVFKLHGLNDTAVQQIEQSRRVNRAGANFEQMGLNEFHIGLIYLYWDEFHAAEKQFESAYRQWSVVTEPAASSLAHIALGFSHEMAFQYEAAMSTYGKCRQEMARIKYSPATKEMKRFRDLIEKCLDEAQTNLREMMRPAPTAAPAAATAAREAVPDHATTSPAATTALPHNAATPEAVPGHDNGDSKPVLELATPVPAPITNLPQEPMPIEGHVKVGHQYRWYEVEKRNQSVILPHVQAGDWLLVHLQPETTVAALAQDQPIVMMYESENDSTILLKPHQPSPRPSAGQRIHLKRLTVETGPFKIENGKAIITREDDQIAFDPANILGLVIGFWRPVSLER